jgi:NDP-sugar pyrophosphorylase family protein
VAGEALVRRILRWLRAGGVGEAVLNLHHRPESIRSSVGDGTGLGVRVRYSHEEILLGTAGGPRRALPLLGADRFILVNGDTLTDVNLEALAADHARTGAQVTMAVVANPDPAFYGGVIVDAGGSVTGFSPKGPANRGYLFVGIQIVDASVFAPLPADRPAETIGDLYPRLIADRPGSVRVFVCGAVFQDIGTPADYLVTSLRIARHEGDPARLVGRRCDVAADARVARTILWDDVTVGSGAALVDCIVSDGVHVPAGASFRRAAIVRGSDCEPGPGDARPDRLVPARFPVKPAYEGILRDDTQTR